MVIFLKNCGYNLEPEACNNREIIENRDIYDYRNTNYSETSSDDSSELIGFFSPINFFTHF